MAKAKRAYSFWLKHWYRIKVEVIYLSFSPTGPHWGGRVSVFERQWLFPFVRPQWTPAVADVIHLITFLHDESANTHVHELKTCTASATCEHYGASLPLPVFGWLATAATVRIGHVVLQGTDRIAW